MCPAQDANAADGGSESGPALPLSGRDSDATQQLLVETLKMLNTLCAQNAMLIEILTSDDRDDDDPPPSPYLDG